MRHVGIIAARELRSIFSTPAAFALFAVYLVFAGYVFALGLGFFLQQIEQIQAYQLMHLLERFNLNQAVIAPALGTFAILFVVAIPLLTMRAFSEERANGTIELLLTCPISTWEIVLGKYLAVLSVVAMLVGLSALFPLLLFFYGNPEPLQTLAGLLGLFLLGAGLAALGCFTSSLTKSQMVAGLVGIVGGLFFWLFDLLADAAQAESWGDPIRYLGIRPHFEETLRGLIRSQDLVYFGVIIVFCLAAARTSLESLRWR
jgi:ABC-2 type transport system permease protein